MLRFRAEPKRWISVTAPVAPSLNFARAYGALCWNLGKVIPRKDLPMIFNTFVPVPNAPATALPTADFEAAREELVDEIRRAPARRVDNMLTQVQIFAERLRLHARVLDAAARELRAYRDRTRRTAEELELQSLPKLRPSELSRLDELIDHKIPKLRSELHSKLTRVP